MPRPIWNGAISFGLVSIPVKMYSATTSKTVRFNQIDAKTGARVRQQRVSEASGELVPYEQIVKGYELASGRYVTITDEELSALDPKASRTIDLLEFVDQSSIDPMFYDAAYYLGPDPATVKPYALLLKAMAEADKVGIARFVMRGREHLAALRPDDGVLLLSTMRYADEIRDAGEIESLEDLASTEVSDAELAMAQQLISSLDATFDPERFTDTYREKVLELIERKEAGEEDLTDLPEEDDGEHKVIDLMAALQASVDEATASRGRHPSDPAATRAASTAKKAPAKKAAAGTAKKAPAKKAAGSAKKAASGAKKAPARKSA